MAMTELVDVTDQGYSDPSERDLVLIGAGTWTRSIVPLFDLESRLLQFYDEPRTPKEAWFGRPVSKNLLEVPYLLDPMVGPQRRKYNAPLGDPRQKRRLIQEIHKLESNPLFINLIWRDNVIVKTAQIGDGVMIQPTAKIYHKSIIGNHASICGDVNVGHDTKIGDYCTLSPYVLLCGGVDIRDGVFLGAGCKILPNITIGEGSILGAGAIVDKDVSPNSVCRMDKAAHVTRGLEDRW